MPNVFAMKYVVKQLHDTVGNSTKLKCFLVKVGHLILIVLSLVHVIIGS